MHHSSPQPTANAAPPGRTAPDSPSIRDMVHVGLAGLDGKAYLIRQAEQNPRAFLSLVGKVLAAELSAARAGAAAPGAAGTTAPAATKLPPGICALVHVVLVAVGGHAYFVRHAEKNPRVFLSLIGKVLAADLRPAGTQRRKRTEGGKPESAHPTQTLPNKQSQPASAPPARAAVPRPNTPQTEGRTPVRPSGTRDLQIAPLPSLPTAVPSTLTRCVSSLTTLVSPSQPDPKPSKVDPALAPTAVGTLLLAGT